MTIPEAYGTQRALTEDSKKFRIRLGAFFKSLKQDLWDKIKSYLELEGGFDFAGAVPSPFYQVLYFFETASVSDLLDAITYVDQALAPAVSGPTNRYTVADPLPQKEWRAFVSKALAEEGLAYRLDAKCGVRYFVDEEFERGRIAAIAELQDPLLAAVLSPTEDAFKYLEARPQDTKAAVRSIFEAVEVIAKVTVPDAPRLSNAWVKGRLKEAYLQGIDRASAEHKIVTRLFESLASWVDALQEYRHGHDEEVSVAPSVEVAIYAISIGCANLRWLAPRAKQLAVGRS